MNNFKTLDNLGVLANILQVLNYMENLEQSGNDDILKALAEQNKQYLEVIKNQNELILKLLRGEDIAFGENQKG